MDSVIVYSPGRVLQTVTSRYSVSAAGKRVAPVSGDVVFTRAVRLSMPQYVCPETWERHGYTIDDVDMVLAFAPAERVYELAILRGLVPSRSAVRPSLDEPESMVCSSKAILRRRIKQWAANNCRLSAGESCLDKFRCQHAPPLPIHRISRAQYDAIRRCVPGRLADASFPRTWRVRGMPFIPVLVEEGALVMYHCMSAEEAELDVRWRHSPVTRLARVTVNGTPCFVTGEYACLLQCEIGSDAMLDT